MNAVNRFMPVVMFTVIPISICFDLFDHEWNLAFWKAMALIYYGTWQATERRIDRFHAAIRRAALRSP